MKHLQGLQYDPFDNLHEKCESDIFNLSSALSVLELSMNEFPPSDVIRWVVNVREFWAALDKTLRKVECAADSANNVMLDNDMDTFFGNCTSAVK